MLDSRASSLEFRPGFPGLFFTIDSILYLCRSTFTNLTSQDVGSVVEMLSTVSCSSPQCENLLSALIIVGSQFMNNTVRKKDAPVASQSPLASAAEHCGPPAPQPPIPTCSGVTRMVTHHGHCNNDQSRWWALFKFVLWAP